MSLIDQLVEIAAGQLSGPASKRAGVSQSATAAMLPLAMTVLMNGLKKNVASSDGAAKLAGALGSHDGGLLDDVDRLSNDDTLADGEKILNHILGAKRASTELALSKAGGVDQSQVASILAMAAPALLASLGRAKREQNLDATALSQLITREGEHAQQIAPAALGGLMQFIDQDGDGDFKDDLLERLSGSLLNGFLGKR
jgi:hypothetical protein